MSLADIRHVTPSPSIERLVQWFRENNGWLNPDVDISYSESHGFHVCATRSLSSPVIVRCPLTLTISHLNLDHSQSTVPHVNSQLQTCLGKVPKDVLTYLLLVEQRCLAKEGKSAWQPYFDCLPSPHEMTTALWFGDDDLRYLQGTDLLPATREKKSLLEAEYHSAVTVLAELNVKLDSANFAFEDYLWAFTIMSSRAFVSTYMLPNIDTFPILFPVLDILNHSTDAKINWAFDKSCFSLELADPTSVLPGHQIFNNYAPKQNGELLMGYGFCIPDNPIEQFAIKMRLPPDMVEAARDMGLYNPDQVPFGLPESVVHNDQSAEQHFLRVRGHPFGRYDIDVPWLRGIPPWIVHSTFVATVMQLGHTPENTNFRKPAGILVLHVLLQIYGAIKAKSLLLPLNPHNHDTTYSNEKQKYADMYRNGQAKVLHSILTELEAVLSNLQ
ncbi:SET domain-containing protein, partial [Periconia macrospinosa]